MRLWDKALTTGGDYQRLTEWHTLAPKTTVFCVDGVAEQYMLSPKVDYVFSDFAFAMPPWNRTFVEWNCPRFFNMGEGLIPVHALSPQQIGFMVDICPEKRLQLLLRQLGQATIPGDNQPDLSKVKAIFSAKPVIFIAGRLAFPEVYANVFLDANGAVLNQMFAGADLVPGTPMRETLMEFLENFVPVVCLAFCFCNCKNTEILDVTAEMEPEEKIKRRLKLPTVRRVTCKITDKPKLYRKWSDQPLGMPSLDGVNAFHLCRGNFATYTDAAPLFGKYVGRYWRPPHTKGKKEHGEIEKVYVAAPVEVPSVA